MNLYVLTFLVILFYFLNFKDSKPVVIEPSPSLSGSRHSLGTSSLDQREDDRTGTNIHGTTEDKSSDNISSASEASESTNSSKNKDCFQAELLCLVSSEVKSTGE